MYFHLKCLLLLLGAGIATGYPGWDSWTGQPRGQSSSFGRVKNVLFSMSSSLLFTPWVKRQGHEAYHSLPASVKVKKIWIYTHSCIHLHGVVVNQLSTGNNFIFTLLLVLEAAKGRVSTQSYKSRITEVTLLHNGVPNVAK